MLRDGGHSVLAVKEAMRGADDAAVPARAHAEARILLTQDKDFGELTFRYGLPAECGVILFRLKGADHRDRCRMQRGRDNTHRIGDYRRRGRA